MGPFLVFKCKPAPEMLQQRPPTARPGSAGVPSSPAAPVPAAENWLQRLAVRSGHSVTVAGTQVLLFGGRLSTEDCLTAQLLRLDKDRMNWHAQVNIVSPLSSAPLAGAVVASCKSGSAMLIGTGNCLGNYLASLAIGFCPLWLAMHYRCLQGCHSRSDGSPLQSTLADASACSAPCGVTCAVPPLACQP